jgi:hypothetical protein
MTLIAFGPATDSDPIVKVELQPDGSLTVELELELGVEIHRVAPMSVAPEVRALLSSSAEQAA